jgi:hypothetical protein
MNARTREIARAVDSIKPHLRGRTPETQGAILADLLAIWLAGHQVEGDSDATRKLRGDILATHLLMVEQLTAVNARIIGTTA